MSKVVPLGDADDHVAPFVSGVLSLKDMDPDFNSDGIVSPIEKEVYDRMLAADVNKDGYLTRGEVYEVMAALKGEVNDVQQSGSIPIKSLNPDADGDGKVERWEVEVFNRIKDADADASGSISVKEVCGPSPTHRLCPMAKAPHSFACTSRLSSRRQSSPTRSSSHSRRGVFFSRVPHRLFASCTRRRS